MPKRSTRESPPSLELPIATRRGFIQSAAGIAGGLVLGIRLPAASAQESGPADASGAARPPPPRNPAAFLRIAPDDTITLVVPSVEMGQGAHTALPMIVLEDLEGDWTKVRIEDAPAAAAYNNPLLRQQMTVGSFSVRGWYGELRKVGAAAREMLVQAAAQRWNVPVSECVASSSVVTHSPTGRKVSYGEVAERASKLPVPANPKLKPASEFKLIGRQRARVDTARKVDGTARFGIDKALPDMLFAAVRTSPTLGGKLASFDDSAARGVPGFHSSVPLPDGVMVLASSYWNAKTALDKTKIAFDPGKLRDLDSAKVTEALRSGFNESGEPTRNDGDTLSALANAARMVEAIYEVPYLAHACMEPMNCTVHATSKGCDVWVSTQAPQRAQQAAAEALGIPAAQVRVHSQYLGGGFGRRGEADFVTQAAIAAKAAGGRPVKLVWSREEDIQHDWYRPAAAVRFKAGFDARNELTAVEARMVTSSAPEGFGRPAFYTDGVADSGYAIPNFRVTGLDRNLGVRFGFWRAVNHSHNPFMMEGFVDELAYEAKQDPFEFRRALLAANPKASRQLAVLELAANKAGWGAPLPKGRARGIAALFAYGSWIANVVEVSVQGNRFAIDRVVCAVDCGIAVNPGTIQAQLEGGMAFGLTAALRGEITLQNGAVMQSNFHDYPLLRISEMPPVEVHLVPSSEPPGGIGEPGGAPIAPALTNALFAATGRRIRSLPLNKQGFEYAGMRI